MKRLFYAGICLLVVFEIANVYFIMPLPYSQRVRSIDLAYLLYSWRWLFRAAFGAMIIAGSRDAIRTAGWRRILAPLTLAVAALVTYGTNVVMAADHMFIAPKSLNMQPVAKNAVDTARLVVGIDIDGEARAYPVQFIGYHHQVRDTVSGKPVMVSFCTVCRTGRVFQPVVDGKTENFRLVGMDHFNAMFEDRTTGTWWRQANGEAIAGPLQGKTLPEIESQQVTLAQWLRMHPASLIMQPDPALEARYSKSFDYETGMSRSSLTGTDTASWQDKSWVVGISEGGESVAYDWNRLKREGVINDVVGGVPVAVALGGDRVSYVAYARPDSATRLVLRGDSLVGGNTAYDFAGRGAGSTLRRLRVSQEFWHSWRTFHPRSRKY